MTNIFMEGEWAVSADDAEWLLRMVEEAHQPFVARPYPGDIATEWGRRCARAQAKPSADMAVAARWSSGPDNGVAALRTAYSGTGRRIETPFDLGRGPSALWNGIE